MTFYFTHEIEIEINPNFVDDGRYLIALSPYYSSSVEGRRTNFEFELKGIKAAHVTIQKTIFDATCNK